MFEAEEGGVNLYSLVVWAGLPGGEGTSETCNLSRHSDRGCQVMALVGVGLGLGGGWACGVEGIWAMPAPE